MTLKMKSDCEEEADYSRPDYQNPVSYAYTGLIKSKPCARQEIGSTSAAWLSPTSSGTRWIFKLESLRLEMIVIRL